MSEPSTSAVNPYESPHGLAAGKRGDGPRQPRRSVAVWATTVVTLFGCLVVGAAACYVVLSWAAAQVPGLDRWFPEGRNYASIAAGAINLFVMACAIAYGQIRATFYFDSIWARTIAWLLLIGAVLLFVGALLLDLEEGVERWLFWPGVAALAMGICMYSWCNQLFAAKMQHRRRLLRPTAERGKA